MTHSHHSSLASESGALIVAHPGHELRVHGWLERVKPVVFVLTDGSGGSREPRIESSRRVITAAGACAGSVFGRFSDRRLYEAMIAIDTGFFTALADEIAEFLATAHIDFVAADAREGYNSGHDICRAVVDAAVIMAEAKAGRTISSMDFLLVGKPDDCPPDGRRLELDDHALTRKLAAARAYPEMALEVDAALRTFGAEAFSVECFRPAARGGWRAAPEDEVPYYERYGAQQVAAGSYSEVVRAGQHIDPLLRALFRHAEERARCTASPFC